MTRVVEAGATPGLATIELASWQIGLLLGLVGFAGHGAATWRLHRRGKGPPWVQFLALWIWIAAVVVLTTTFAYWAVVIIVVGGNLVLAALRWVRRRKHRS